MPSGRTARPSPVPLAMDVAIAAAVFPVIFIGELPDKTMLASLVMAGRGRPRAVWVGAAGAFLVHVAIATTVGVALVDLLPRRAVDGVVAFLFLAGAAYALLEGRRAGHDAEVVAREVASHRRVAVTAFVVIFLAEWGDLTQILTANLAARYHSALSVAVGSTLALWSVAGLAVSGGAGVLRVVDVTTVRRLTAAVLLALGVYSAVGALR